MRRHKYLILYIFLTLPLSLIYGQDKPKAILQIRKEYKEINSDKSLKRKVLKNEEFLDNVPDGGGALTGFHKGDQIKKITTWVGLSYGNTKLEFYFSNNELIFVYEETNSFVYDKKREKFRMDTTERSFEGRYYFSKNKLLDYVTLGHNRFEDDTIDPGKTLLKEAKKYRKLLSSKRS